MADPFEYSRATSWPVSVTHGQAFADNVSRWGEHMAAVGLDGSLTYRQLRGRAEQLLDVLPPGNGRVALLSDNALPYVVGQAAIYLAARCGVLLDPANPPGRLRKMLANAQVDALLVSSAWLGLALELEDLINGPIVEIIDGGPQPGTTSRAVAARDPSAEVVIVFTSGSTGTPKGTVVSEIGSLETCRLYGDLMDVGPGSIVGVLQHFSNSWMHPFTALMRGATLAMYDIPRLGLGGIADWMDQFGVTTARLFPTVFRQLCAGLPPHRRMASLRTVVLTGEAAYAADVKRLRRVAPGARFLSVYSSTESGPISAVEVRPGDALPEDGALPLGRPLRGKQIELMAEDGRLVTAPGHAGELHIVSKHFFSGYVGGEETGLTRDADGERWRFAIRDRAVWRPDGALQHVGRADVMLKVRGNRIDQAEIEQALIRLADVVHVAVTTFERAGGVLSLAAHVVLTPGSERTITDLRQELALYLPSSIMPSRLEILTELPMSATGKVLRSALQQRAAAAHQHRFPNPTEAALAAMWRDLLPDAGISGETDFFAAGGDSLAAATALLEVEATFGVRLPLTVFAAHPTLTALAKVIGAPGEQGAEPPLVPLVVNESGKTVFCIAGIRGHVLRLLQIRDDFSEPVGLYGLQPPGLKWPAGITLARIADFYVKQMRSLEPAGPYHLLGASYGGIIAFEIARQLEAAGERVEWIVMLDTPMPLATEHWDWRTTLDVDSIHSKLARTHREAIERYRDCLVNATIQADLYYVMAMEHPIRAADDRNWVPYFRGRARYYPVPGMHGAFHVPPQRSYVARIVEGLLRGDVGAGIEGDALFAQMHPPQPVSGQPAAPVADLHIADVHETPFLAHLRGDFAAALRPRRFDVYVDGVYYGWSVPMRRPREGRIAFDIKLQLRSVGDTATLVALDAQNRVLARHTVNTA